MSEDCTLSAVDSLKALPTPLSRNQLRQGDERLLTAILSAAQDAIILMDNRGKITLWNNAAERVFGYSHDEAIGNDLHDLLAPPKYRVQQQDRFEVFRTTGTGDAIGKTVELEAVRKGGELFPIELSLSAFQAEGEWHALGIVRDVTAAHRARSERERMLSKTEEQKALLTEQHELLSRERRLLSTIINSIPHAVFWKDRESRYLGCNSVFAKKAGLDNPGEIDGLHDFDLPWSRAEAEHYRFCDQHVMASGESIINLEESQTGPDGEDRVLLTSKTPLLDNDGVVVGMVGIFADVTEKKFLERQLSQAQKLESIGQLSAGIAHEINTPMQYVSHNLHFLSKCCERLFTVVDRYRELLDAAEAITWRDRREEIDRIAERCRFDHIRDQFPRAVEECREGIERTIKIVKAMKDFSHPGDKTKSSVNVNEAIESAIEISRNRWKCVAEVKLELAPELPLVPAYAAELNQVLLNLIINSADAIADRFEDGELGQITVRSRHSSSGVQVDVEDNGCGIPQAIREKVFDPFFTTKQVGKGTGQGLAIAHNVVVNMHGGEIAVESAEGQGTTFTVRLPCDSLEIAGDPDVKKSFAEA